MFNNVLNLVHVLRVFVLDSMCSFQLRNKFTLCLKKTTLTPFTVTNRCHIVAHALLFIQEIQVESVSFVFVNWLEVRFDVTKKYLRSSLAKSSCLSLDGSILPLYFSPVAWQFLFTQVSRVAWYVLQTWLVTLDRCKWQLRGNTLCWSLFYTDTILLHNILFSQLCGQLLNFIMSG